MSDGTSVGCGDAITVVVTSCQRFDLLAETLASFLAHNTAPIARYCLIEDSGNDRVRDVVAGLNVPVDVIVNDHPFGQIAAIDLAYRGVGTPYIFHCEDDWRFFRPGFIEQSLLVLQHDPLATSVLCRRPGQNLSTDLVFENCPLMSAGPVRYRKPHPWMVPYWHGYSFNPGLCRLADYRRIGSFSRWGDEMDVSLYFKLRCRTVAILADPACETTGQERRLPKLSPRRSLRARWQLAAAKYRYKLAKCSGHAYRPSPGAA